MFYDEYESIAMSATAIATVAKMMASLPEPVQGQVVEHLREYLEDLQDELQRDALLKKTQPQLIAAARRAKQETAQGLAKPMAYDQL
jgi:uncharacterized protein YdbL (DUF1318 family)